MKSKTKIEKQTSNKTNKELVKTIQNLKKNENWINIARIISGPRKNLSNLNLEKINTDSKEGDIVVIPGKVLSQGEIDKKIKIIALGFSKKAIDKLSKSKTEFSFINEEVKKNPNAKEIKILK